jgi:hypothetical protein
MRISLFCFFLLAAPPCCGFQLGRLSLSGLSFAVFYAMSSVYGNNTVLSMRGATAIDIVFLLPSGRYDDL